MRMADNAIVVDSVSKSFQLPHQKNTSVKNLFINAFKKNTYETQKVLNGVSFEIKKGEFFGIVGRNGSGKSTLLKLLAGIYSPNSGVIQINGKLTPFIELGVGFNPELTGKENVYMNGALLGFTRKEVELMYDEIVEFAELEKFMDQKLKNYSSGMQVRLAFSIAIKSNSDILLIDEVLAVGDAAFQRKCFDVFKNIKQSNRTVVFISHDMGAVREYCDRAMLLEDGSIIASGDPSLVANKYLQLFVKDTLREDTSERWGDGKVTIEDVVLTKTDKTIDIKYNIDAKDNVEHPIIGIIIRDLENHHIFDSNTKWKRIETGIITKGEKKLVHWQIPNVFKNGSYTITLALAHKDGLSFYDWREKLVKFQIEREEETAGMLVLGDKIHIK